MKTLFTWIALVASTPFWLTSSALADDAAQYEIALAKERQQSITQAKTPDGIATQKIDWKTPGTGVGSFKIIPAEPLPLGWKIPAVSKLYIPEGGGLKSFNLRVEDAFGDEGAEELVAVRLGAAQPAIVRGPEDLRKQGRRQLERADQLPIPLAQRADHLIQCWNQAELYAMIGA